jgi:hypothetical protein
MTEVPLREYFQALREADDRRYLELRDAQEKAVVAALAAQEKAVNAALAAAEKAVAVAETNAEKWRMNANEWRAAMNDRERQFFSRGMGYVVGAVSVVSAIVAITGRFVH